MEKIYRDADVDMSILNGKTVAVIGYGIQGKVQAANARDSGVQGHHRHRGRRKQSPSRDQAKADGFEALSIAEATKKADMLLIELADPAQPPIYKDDIAPNLAAGKTLCFCHGFNVLYGAIQPPKNVNMVLYVPNAPGHFVREKYQERRRHLRLRQRRSRRDRQRQGDRAGDRQSRRQHAGRRRRDDVPARNRGGQLRGANPLRRRDPTDAALLSGDGRERLSAELCLCQGDPLVCAA